MLTPEERARLRELLDAATPTPWKAVGEWIDGATYEVLSPARPDCMSYCYGGESQVEYGTEHDQTLIVGAVNALPGLLAAVDAAEAERDRLAKAVERVRALAEGWRYKGEHGYGPWQAGSGPSPDGEALDWASSLILRALDGGE